MSGEPLKSSCDSCCDRGGKGIEAFEADFQVAEGASERTLDTLGQDDVFSLGVLVSKGVRAR
jgi:hypothetical protein